MSTPEDGCKFCSNKSFSTLETIKGEEGKTYDIDMHNDGTIMLHMYNHKGFKQKGSRIGQLKYCPKCGRKFK